MPRINSYANDYIDAHRNNPAITNDNSRPHYSCSYTNSNSSTHNCTCQKRSD